MFCDVVVEGEEKDATERTPSTNELSKRDLGAFARRADAEGPGAKRLCYSDPRFVARGAGRRL